MVRFLFGAKRNTQTEFAKRFKFWEAEAQGHRHQRKEVGSNFRWLAEKVLRSFPLRLRTQHSAVTPMTQVTDTKKTIKVNLILISSRVLTLSMRRRQCGSRACQPKLG